MTTRACPVLFFTAEVDAALAWFDLTHERAPDGGLYQQVKDPAPGGPGAQDMRLAESLELLCSVHNHLLVGDWRRARMLAASTEQAARRSGE